MNSGQMVISFIEKRENIMTEKEIPDLTDKWHEGDYSCELYEFLGMTLEEYGKYVEMR